MKHKALRSIGINETCITILEDIYTELLQEHIWIIQYQKKYK